MTDFVIENWMKRFLVRFLNPDGIDFKQIEQAGHIKLSDAQRKSITMLINLFKAYPRSPCLYPAKEIRRRFRRGIDAGYQFLEFMDFTQKILPHPFECEVISRGAAVEDFLKEYWSQKGKSEDRSTKKDFLHTMKEIFGNYIIFCNRIKRYLKHTEDFLKEYQGQRGRATDREGRDFVFSLLREYEDAGGDFGVSWNTRSQHYTGAVLGFVKSVLTQAGYAPHSDDALAQLIRKAKK